MRRAVFFTLKPRTDEEEIPALCYSNNKKGLIPHTDTAIIGFAVLETKNSNRVSNTKDNLGIIQEV